MPVGSSRPPYIAKNGKFSPSVWRCPIVRRVSNTSSGVFRASIAAPSKRLSTPSSVNFTEPFSSNAPATFMSTPTPSREMPTEPPSCRVMRRPSTEALPWTPLIRFTLPENPIQRPPPSARPMPNLVIATVKEWKSSGF